MGQRVDNDERGESDESKRETPRENSARDPNDHRKNVSSPRNAGMSKCTQVCHVLQLSTDHLLSIHVETCSTRVPLRIARPLHQVQARLLLRFEPFQLSIPLDGLFSLLLHHPLLHSRHGQLRLRRRLSRLARCRGCTARERR